MELGVRVCIQMLKSSPISLSRRPSIFGNFVENHQDRSLKYVYWISWKMDWLIKSGATSYSMEILRWIPIFINGYQLQNREFSNAALKNCAQQNATVKRERFYQWWYWMFLSTTIISSNNRNSRMLALQHRPCCQLESFFRDLYSIRMSDNARKYENINNVIDK